MSSLSSFHKHLQLWYRQHGRHHLPWRNSTDPYAIYISEVMLQQTQVQTVLERYYFPFLAAFPTLAALGNASEQEVLKAWQGLGYYSRAVNLRKAAHIASPSLPSSVEQLTALPGIGKNTAHAIAAFGFHLPVPVMEANVKRVLYRIFALESASEKLLWEKASSLLDKDNPFDYNQAMMDIGALVCTKTRPDCANCPLSMICEGKKDPIRYPAPKQKKTVPEIEKNIIVFMDAAHRCYIKSRTSRFLYGLYGFCEYAKDQPIVFHDRVYRIESMRYLGHITQHYSHFTLQADIYVQSLPGKKNSGAWKNGDEIGALPVSMADSKILKLLEGTSLSPLWCEL